MGTAVGGTGSGGCPRSCFSTCQAANFASTTTCTYTHVTTGIFLSGSQTITRTCTDATEQQQQHQRQSPPSQRPLAMQSPASPLFLDEETRSIKYLCRIHKSKPPIKAVIDSAASTAVTSLTTAIGNAITSITTLLG